MAENTAGVVSKDSSVEVSKDTDMELKQAFNTVRFSDAKIKEIYSTRTGNDVNVGSTLYLYTIQKYFLSGVAIVPVLFFLGTTFNVMHILFPAWALVFMLTVVASVFDAGNKMLSPKKYRKLKAKYDINQQLIEFHEETMAVEASKVLKKAKKAMKVINKALQDENQKVYYRNEKGNEGFVFENNDSHDQWDIAYAQVSAKESRKELESLRTNQYSIEAPQPA